MSNKILSGRYELLVPIGVGGMATVYKARDLKEDRIVAVKILDNKMVNNQQKVVDSFFHEVKVMSRIKHDNCVRIYDHGIDGLDYYIVMEYVNGVTLQRIIEDNGKLSPSKAVKYAVQILSALDEAYKNKIIHRDIKPQNILVDKNGKIKVADFGISRLIDAKTKSINEKDTILGSVHYVSPEQAKGNQVDNRSDLYSLGIVLYEMLTGHPPFDNDDPLQIVLMHCNNQPESMQKANENISPALDKAVLKALKKDPGERYTSAVEMARELKRALRHPDFVGDEQNSRLQKVKGYIHSNLQNGLLIGLSVLTLIGIVGYGCGKVADVVFKTDVPKVTGKLLSEAETILTDNDFGYTIEEIYTDESTTGMVITQDPAAKSRVNKNSTVILTVSLGSQPVELKDTIGMERSKALQLLSDCGFPEVSIRYSYDPSKKMDTVLLQSPSAGLVKPSETVTLTINSAPIELPVLCGKSMQQALDILESLNLSARVIASYSPDETPDTVLLQSPAPGQKLMRGTTVTIAVTLDASEVYYCDYYLQAPLDIHITATLKTPSGLEFEVYDADTQMDEVIHLALTSEEAGTHILTVKYGDTTTTTETLEFE